MKITSIRLDRLVLPLEPPFPAAWDPVPRGSFAATIVRVETDAGVVGIGSGDTMDGFEAYAHLFVGQDPRAIARHVRALETIDFHAGRFWPLEAALWDIVGQVAGLPVATLFGGALDGLPAYASCGMLLEPAARAESALRLREEGFRAIKVRVDPRDLERGIAAVTATRHAVGDSMAIMVDLNQGWRMPGDTSRSLDPVTAREIAVRLAELGVLWLEEPLAGTDLAGLAALRASAPGVRIAGGEMTRTFPELLDALESDAFDVHQPDVVLAAGMLRARTVAEVAIARNRWFTPHTWTNGIGLLANLHVAAGVGGGPFLEFPYDPPGWTPERRDFMLAEPIRPGRRRCAPRPGGARTRRRPRRHGHAPIRRVTGSTRGAVDWVGRAATLAPRTEVFIDGRFMPAASGRVFDDVTGRDGTVIATVAEGDAEDIDRAVTAARRSFDDRRWSDQTPAARKRVLLRLADLIRENLDELALLEALDVGKPIRDTLRVDVPSAATTFQWYAETIDKTYGEVGPTGPDALSLVTREPIGVVAAIVPWNYPLIISAWKLGAALATGNSVVLKPASSSPLTALRVAELAVEAGLPDGVLNVVPGPGAVLGRALARHPDVDKIAFTGSTAVGQAILREMGDTGLKAVTLEAGGKSPQVVFADVGDLDAAASAIGWGIFYNSGQTCNAGSRLIVHRSVRDGLVERIASLGAALAPGDPLDPRTKLGSIVDARQLEQVLEYVALGRHEGARVVAGGERVLEETGGFYLPPTILDDVDNGWRVAREEIFGPVLTVTTFEDEAEAIAIANDSPFGLAAGVWTRDINRAHRIARRIRAGTVWVNTFDTADITVPFGGFKQSGFGRDKSLHALDGYTQLKTTWFDLSGQ